MNNKNLIASIYIKNKEAVESHDSDNVIFDGDVISLASHYSNNGADCLLLFDLSTSDKEQDEAISLIKEISRVVDIPMISCGNIKRMEDVKKLLYAGSSMVLLNYTKEENISLTKEVSDRFGKEKIGVFADSVDLVKNNIDLISKYTNAVLLSEGFPLSEMINRTNIPLLVFQKDSEQDLIPLLKTEQVSGVYGNLLNRLDINYTELKYTLKESGIPVNTFESQISFHEFKLNDDGLLPVIVQDYKTDEVLMLAYMNEEAFYHTLKSGKMTYYSRSRKEQWVKGETSGHFQYVKSLSIDCDYDTLLAKVSQAGVACHTGNKTCFFNSLAKKDYQETNPLKVFEDVYGVILDRKNNPKEGSYTNYLFDKGIDKILKKVGEEATEIIIAAKNPDPEEIKYEISDFLYHVMVLMAEKGVSWDDITKELARR